MHDALIIAGFFLMVLSPCLVGLHAANSEVSLWVALRRFGMRRRLRVSRRIASVSGTAWGAVYRVVALRRRAPRWNLRMPRVFSRLRSSFSLRRIQNVVRFARLGFQTSSRGRRLSNLSARH